MIKGDRSIDNTLIIELPVYSRKKVLRVCDSCLSEAEVEWSTIFRCRKKHPGVDYCFKCACRIFNSGDKNKAKTKEVKAKMSLAMRGKAKSFKDGKNLRILPEKLNAAGYHLVWSDKYNKHIQKHRLVYADHFQKSPFELNEIHHIDGNKSNNLIENLVELERAEHAKLHNELESLAFNLVKNKCILFSKSDKKYYLSPDFELNLLPKSLSFCDISICQNKNIMDSRLSVDISSEIIRGVKVKIPLIAANMSTVVNADFYLKINKCGAFAVLHRAQNIDNYIIEVNKIKKECEYVAASIGIGNDQFELAKLLIKNGCNIIFIDVAHGFADSVIEIGSQIKKYDSTIKVVLGNTINPNLLLQSYRFADAIKVGIAQGFACETANTAGCTEGQFSAVFKFKQISKDFGIPIISDGGIREGSDFTKAIAAGANSVMAGKIFAACPESAAQTTVIDGKEKKIYAGMASRFVQNEWRGGLKSGTCPEGRTTFLDIGEDINSLLERYSGALKTGITYAGASDILSFHKNVQFILNSKK